MQHYQEQKCKVACGLNRLAYHAVHMSSFISPLQVGLSMTLEHKYGHCDLVDMINKLGFCSSHTEANKYRSNTVVVQGVDLSEKVACFFLHYQADNVDHASNTLDGHGSIHVVGQMATFIPAIQSTRRIP